MNRHHAQGLHAAIAGNHALAVTLLSQSIQHAPKDATTYCNLGKVLQDSGRLPEAAAFYHIAAALKPDLATAHFNLGNTLRDQNHLAEACISFQRAIEARPDFAAAHTNLGNVLHAQGDLSDAIACYRAALRADKLFASAQYNLGNALREAGHLAPAIEALREAIRLAPHDASAHHNLGIAYQEQGEIGKAVTCFSTATFLAPERGLFARALAATGRLAPNDPALARMARLMTNPDRIAPHDQMEFHFALGIAHASLGNATLATPHLLEANRRKRAVITYNEAATLGALASLAQAFTRESLTRDIDGAAPGPIPIFIVGMPRAGSTLVEQILASHPLVHSVGESNILTVSVHQYPGNWDQIGRAYSASLTSHAPAGATHVIDKLPENFARIGVIRLALPQARIIHVHRDPVATCLSCFSRHFSGHLPYTYDLGELGRYYRAYQRLMAHWRAALPADTLLDQAYEDILADMHGQTRRLLAFCGLPWTDSCLHFYRNGKPVRTASAAQVRAPLDRQAATKWRGYTDLAARLDFAAV